LKDLGDSCSKIEDVSKLHQDISVHYQWF